MSFLKHSLTLGVGIAILVASGSGRVLAVERDTELDHILLQQMIPNLTVVVMQDNQIVAQSVAGSQSAQPAIAIDTVRYIGLNSEQIQPRLVAQFLGTNALPGLVVTIRFSADNLAQSTTVDADGNWKIQIPLEHTQSTTQSAYMTIRQGEQISQSYVVGQFEIQRAELLSQDTWMFLLTAFLAIVTLLFAITIQVRHNMKPQPGMLY